MRVSGTFFSLWLHTLKYPRSICSSCPNMTLRNDNSHKLCYWSTYWHSNFCIKTGLIVLSTNQPVWKYDNRRISWMMKLCPVKGWKLSCLKSMRIICAVCVTFHFLAIRVAFLPHSPLSNWSTYAKVKKQLSRIILGRQQPSLVMRLKSTKTK